MVKTVIEFFIASVLMASKSLNVSIVSCLLLLAAPWSCGPSGEAGAAPDATADMSGSWDGAKPPYVLDGTVTFERDEARTATDTLGEYGATLEVTDAAGLVWSLHVPKQAGLLPLEVSMTAISALQAGPDGPVLEAGVVFEPDGLLFVEGARLRVTLSGDAETVAFYRFAGDGSGLQLAPFRFSDHEFTVDIEHFSGAAAARFPSVAALCAQATADYEAQLLKVQALKGTEITIPDPPSVDLTCVRDKGKATARQRACDDYVGAVELPEGPLAAAMIAADRARTLVCGGDSRAFQDLSPILWRWYKKITLLTKLPRRADTYYPVLKASLRLERQYSLLSSEASPSVAIPSGASRAAAARDELLKRLKDEHDLQVVDAILPLDRDACMLGPDTCDLETTLKKLSERLRFQVTLDVSLDVNEPTALDDQGQYCVPGAKGHIATSAKGTFQYDAAGDELTPATIPSTVDEGMLEVPFMDEVGCGFDETRTLVGPAAFEAGLRLDFDPCDEAGNEIAVATIGTNELTAQTEVWHADIRYPHAPADDHSEEGVEYYTAMFAWPAFKTYAPDPTAPPYVFRPTIENRTATPIDQTWSGTSAASPRVEGSLHLKIEHTPL